MSDKVVGRIGPQPPIEYYRFTVDGCVIPNLTGKIMERSDWEDQITWELVFDGRFSITATGAELNYWLWFLANACAVSAGFTYHGPESRPLNPYSRKAMIIGDTE